MLKYLNSKDRCFHTFVANRISTIRETSEPSQRRHVGSTDNIADDASRGLRVFDFQKNSRWPEGPMFLWKPEEDWPKPVLEVSVDYDNQEVRKETTVNVMCDISSPTDQHIAYFF